MPKNKIPRGKRLQTEKGGQNKTTGRFAPSLPFSTSLVSSFDVGYQAYDLKHSLGKLERASTWAARVCSVSSSRGYAVDRQTGRACVATLTSRTFLPALGAPSQRVVRRRRGQQNGICCVRYIQHRAGRPPPARLVKNRPGLAAGGTTLPRRRVTGPNRGGGQSGKRGPRLCCALSCREPTSLPDYQASFRLRLRVSLRAGQAGASVLRSPGTIGRRMVGRTALVRS